MKFQKEVKAVKEEPEVSSMPLEAYSVARNPNGGWAVVKVGFNLADNTAKVLEVKPVSQSRTEAEFQFKIDVGHYFEKMDNT